MKKPTQKGGGQHLDDDDHALWSHTARSVKPLARNKGRHHPAIEPAADGSADASHGSMSMKPKRDGLRKAPTGKTKTAPTSTLPAARAAKPAAAPLASFDRKNARKIRSGRVEIEARIDLHGMRQNEAHVALVRFLHRCQSKGQRWVLVITGKGKATDHDHYAPFDMSSDRQRGILKRNVPRWLDEPELRPLVISYATAAISHGGEGALYVHLRKAR